MDIVTAMTEINMRLLAVAIASPQPMSIAKVWDPIPPDSVAISDFPCFLASLSFVDTDRNASQFVERYVLHLQLFIKEADRDIGRRLARAFHVALIAALGPHPTLAGKVTDWSLRGGTPSEGDYTRNNVTYPGLDLYMDITIKNAMTFDAA